MTPVPLISIHSQFKKNKENQSSKIAPKIVGSDFHTNLQSPDAVWPPEIWNPARGGDTRPGEYNRLATLHKSQEKGRLMTSARKTDQLASRQLPRAKTEGLTRFRRSTSSITCTARIPANNSTSSGFSKQVEVIREQQAYLGRRIRVKGTRNKNKMIQ